jgi:hypothetical protein
MAEARPNLARRAAAEGFATFALVFAGCGAIVADKHSDGGIGVVGVGLVFGLIIMVMVYATGHLSGAHISPRRRPARRVGPAAVLPPTCLWCDALPRACNRPRRESRRLRRALSGRAPLATSGE